MNRTMVRLAALVATLYGLALAPHASADEYSKGWGPALNTPMPLLAAPDHTGRTRSLGDLAGEHGLLLFLNRSADW